ncbi:MAG TPA: hypothetical protein VD699_06395 [Nitrosopumilaceae archaeon]|nr:hypothetical protein [Nitrosopumilaceae archaeon]
MQRGISLNSNHKKLPENSSSFKEPECVGYKLKKEIVIYVLNRTLLESGKEVYDMVNRSFHEKYRCDISESFDKPEYLVDVLKYVFDGSYLSIREILMKNLEIFSKENGIREFLQVLKTSI